MRKPDGRRTDLMDTSPEIHAELIRRLQALTPEQRIAKAIEASQLAVDMLRARKSREANQ